MLYVIEICGTCNLRCPSCAVGNMNAEALTQPRPKGFMEFEMFERIVTKAEAECSALGESLSIALYNWGEPLIHPEIEKILGLLHERGIEYYISSNLNARVDLLPVIRNEPTLFRISLSGATNATYQKNHVRGDINMVISNLYQIRHHLDTLAKRSGRAPRTRIQVLYHLYRDNCGDDLAKMLELCQNLGFELHPILAYLTPLERVAPALVDSSRMTPKDREINGRLFFPIEELFSIAQQVATPACRLLESEVPINHDGSLHQCCAVYDRSFTVADSYLDLSFEEVQKTRSSNPACGKCFRSGMHDVFQMSNLPYWNELLAERQRELGTPHIADLVHHSTVRRNLPLTVV